MIRVNEWTVTLKASEDPRTTRFRAGDLLERMEKNLYAVDVSDELHAVYMKVEVQLPRSRYSRQIQRALYLSSVYAAQKAKV